MEITSLFLRTEHLFWQRLSRLSDLGDALAITTDRNPYWNWGNLLILQDAPKVEDVDRWLDRFHRSILDGRESRYTLFTWDSGEIDDAALQVYQQRGLKLSLGHILQLGKLVKPDFYNLGVRVREVAANDDALWCDVTQLDIEGFAEQFPNTRYPEYAEQNFREHRAMVTEGLGKWFAAFLGDELVGSLGIYPGEGFYRYQEVVVKKEHRRHGIASTMLYEVSQRALEKRPEFQQVIVTEPDADSSSVYARLGFELHSISQALQGRIEAVATKA